jgi:hypothetical protein
MMEAILYQQGMTIWWWSGNCTGEAICQFFIW